MADEVVVGSTRKDAVFTIIDGNGAVVNLSGGSVKMQGRSNELPSKTIDVIGTLTDPANGKVTFASIGTIITAGDLTGADPDLASATFRLRLRYLDSAAKIDYGPEFEFIWVHDPTVLI